MDLRIDKVRASLIQKIQNSNDLEKLDQMLHAFDNPESISMTREAYLQRTREGLQSAREDRKCSLEEVRAHIGIHGGK